MFLRFNLYIGEKSQRFSIQRLIRFHHVEAEKVHQRLQQVNSIHVLLVLSQICLLLTHRLTLVLAKYVEQLDRSTQIGFKVIDEVVGLLERIRLRLAFQEYVSIQ